MDFGSSCLSFLEGREAAPPTSAGSWVEISRMVLRFKQRSYALEYNSYGCSYQMLVECQIIVGFNLHAFSADGAFRELGSVLIVFSGLGFEVLQRERFQTVQ